MAAAAGIIASWVATAITGTSITTASILAGSAVYAATYTGVVVAELYALDEVSSLINPPPKVGGQGAPTDFKADPQAPVPYVIGRTGTAGSIVFADVAGDKNKYLTYVTVLSLGPVKSIGAFEANQVLTQFTSDSGEGAGTGQQTTSLSAPAGVGAAVISVGATTGFQNGQAITVGGEAATINTVYANAGEISLRAPLSTAHAQYAPVLGPSTTSFYQNRMWWKASLGPANAAHLTWTATGSKDTPADHSGIPTTWDSNAKLSGLAHTLWTMEFDAAKYPTGTPKPLQVVEGVFCYDPRLDSTYPGGSGSCRSNDETTFVYSENPYIHAITWLIGRYSNGVKTMGVHAPLSAIDMAAFVAGANVADANGWRVGGVIYSTDSKWDVLKAMLIAGGGAPVKRGATISCMVSAPQTSLDTITAAEVVGDASIPASASKRTRINGVWPRYREETQNWQIVPTAAPVVVSSYVTADGEQRTREVEYTLVQDANQVSQLACYDIENAREFGPIVLPCKPRWMGYRPGDCLTIDEPEYCLSAQKCIVLNRSVDPATMITTLTLRSETDAKHAFALGQTGSAPPTPGLTAIDPTFVSTPASSDWAAVGGVASSSSGSVPQIVVTGACSDPNVASVIIEYQLNTTGAPWADWTEAKSTTVGTAITGLAPATAYNVGVRYRSVRGVVGSDAQRLVLGPVTTGGIAAGTAANVPWTGVTDPAGTRPANNATVGATTGVNLVSGTYGTLADGGIVTALGTAAAISGQGALATQSNVNLSSQVTGTLGTGNAAAGLINSNITIASNGALSGAGGGAVTFGGLGGGAVGQQSTLKLGGAYLFQSNGSTALSDGTVVTSLGTAAAIAGQGALATLGAVDLSGSTVINKKTSNLTDDANLGGTAAWTGVSARPTELTDGRITTALNSSGVLQTNLTTTVANSSNLLRYTAGGLFTGELTADTTSTHTAAAIAGQGALATQSNVNLSSQVTGALGTGNAAAGLINSNITIASNGSLSGAGGGSVTFGGLGGGAVGQQSTLKLGGAYLFQSNGSTALSDGTVVTSLGTAAAIAGQGGLATRSTINYGLTDIPSLPAAVQPGNMYLGTYINAGYAYNPATGGALQTYWPATTAADQTSNATAAAISGQAATATSSDFASVTGTTKPANNATVGATTGVNLVSGTYGTLTDGGIVTALGTAAAISGQGALATQSNVNLSSQVTGALGTGNAAAGLINSNITIASNGALSGAGGGSVTFGGLGGGAVGQQSTLKLGGAYLFQSNGSTALSDGTVVTSLGTAAAIAGQGTGATTNVGALATKNTAGTTDLAANAATGYSIHNTGMTQPAAASITVKFSVGSQTADGDTLTIGSETYTFKSVVTSPSTQIALASTAAAQAANIAAALNAYSSVAVATQVVTSTNSVITLSSQAAGASGNGVSVTYSGAFTVMGTTNFSGGSSSSQSAPDSNPIDLSDAAFTVAAAAGGNVSIAGRLRCTHNQTSTATFSLTITRTKSQAGQSSYTDTATYFMSGVGGTYVDFPFEFTDTGLNGVAGNVTYRFTLTVGGHSGGSYAFTLGNIWETFVESKR